MPVPCYGCGQTARVDRRCPKQALLLAGWIVSGGETYCQGCSVARGLASAPAETAAPKPSAPPPPTGIAIADAATSRAASQCIRVALATAAAGAAALAALIVMGGAGRAWVQPLTVGGTFGLLLLSGGLGAARRARRWQILLAGSEWRAYRLTYVRVRRRAPGLVLVPEDESLPPLLLRLGAVFRWRSPLLRTAVGRTVWVGGDPNSHAVLALHPGPHLFPAEPIRPRNLGRYRAAAAQREAVEALSPEERRAAVEKAHRKAELSIVVGWGIMGLATISPPTTVAWLVLAAETIVWGAAVIRIRMARDRELDTVEREFPTPEPPRPRAVEVPDAR
jgi:hypothetical protein